MSGRHQQSRRRSYGRRQHEINERLGRLVATMEWQDDRDPGLASIHIWDSREPLPAGFGQVPQRRTV